MLLLLPALKSAPIFLEKTAMRNTILLIICLKVLFSGKGSLGKCSSTQNVSENGLLKEGSLEKRKTIAKVGQNEVLKEGSLEKSVFVKMLETYPKTGFSREPPLRKAVPTTLWQSFLEKAEIKFFYEVRRFLPQ